MESNKVFDDQYTLQVTMSEITCRILTSDSKVDGDILSDTIFDTIKNIDVLKTVLNVMKGIIYGAVSDFIRGIITKIFSIDFKDWFLKLQFEPITFLNYNRLLFGQNEQFKLSVLRNIFHFVKVKFKSGDSKYLHCNLYVVQREVNHCMSKQILHQL